MYTITWLVVTVTVSSTLFAAAHRGTEDLESNEPTLAAPITRSIRPVMRGRGIGNGTNVTVRTTGGSTAPVQTSVQVRRTPAGVLDVQVIAELQARQTASRLSQILAATAVATALVPTISGGGIASAVALGGTAAALSAGGADGATPPSGGSVGGGSGAGGGTTGGVTTSGPVTTTTTVTTSGGGNGGNDGGNGIGVAGGAAAGCGPSGAGASSVTTPVAAPPGGNVNVSVTNNFAPPSAPVATPATAAQLRETAQRLIERAGTALAQGATTVASSLMNLVRGIGQALQERENGLGRAGELDLPISADLARLPTESDQPVASSGGDARI